MRKILFITVMCTSWSYAASPEVVAIAEKKVADVRQDQWYRSYLFKRQAPYE